VSPERLVAPLVSAKAAVLLKDGRLARLEPTQDGGLTMNVIGRLPRQGDFEIAAQHIAAANPESSPIVAQRLLSLWRSDAIHPAEVANDNNAPAALTAPTEKPFGEWRMSQGLGMDRSPPQENPLAPKLPGFNSVGAQSAHTPVASAAGPEGAQAILSQRLGLATRSAAQELDLLGKSQGDFAKLPHGDRLAFADYVENRSQGAALPANLSHLQQAADAIRSVNQDVLYDWQATKSGETLQGLDDYLRHEIYSQLSSKQQELIGASAEGSTRGAGKARVYATIGSPSRRSGRGV
jgi:hypothetical protein